MSVGSIVGPTEYSVDRINYLDGENTKSVDVLTNNEFQIDVYKSTPVVERDNPQVTKTSISFDVSITDVDNVISEGTMVAKLFSGVTLIKSWDLTTGTQNVSFSDLSTDKFYDLKIQASFDLLDGNGIQSNFVLVVVVVLVPSPVISKFTNCSLEYSLAYFSLND